jgi:N-acetyl sugar amidotransferase
MITHPLEKQILNQPKEVIFCKKCVMSNQRPRITFDLEGVCGGCRNTQFFKNSINWKKREEELLILLDQYRKNDGSWDVIVPSSGGKDSAFVAHQLKFKYGMNPLTVTWSPLKYTNIGWQNMQALRDSGFSNILASPNGKLHRQLARLSFEEFGDAFHVFVLGQISYAFHIAVNFNIPLVMFGENGEAEYAGDPIISDKPYIPVELFQRLYFKGTSLDEIVKYGIHNKDYFEKNFTRADLDFYRPPSNEQLKKVGVKGKFFFGYFKKWIPQENFFYAAEHTGFKPNTERTEGTYSKYASIDDKLDGLHYYMKFIKFGFGRTTDDASHEVRDGHITREEAVALVEKYDGEFPEKFFQEFLEYLGINQGQFWDIVDSWRPSHLWKKEKNNWKLYKTVFSEKT